MIRNEFAWAAHLLTLGNLFLGFYAIIQVIDGNYLMACWLIVIAAIIDGLDGKIARFTHSSSEIGIELDSFADTVSFGVAPAILLYYISFEKFGFAGVALSSLPLLFGVARLARFNRTATTGEKMGYEGLPIPMMASTIATFVVFNYAIWHSFLLEFLLIPMTLALALLMISHVPYEAMPRFTFHDSKKNLIRLMLMFGGVILLAVKPSMVFFPLAVIYILKGLVIYIFRTEEEEDELEEPALGD